MSRPAAALDRLVGFVLRRPRVTVAAVVALAIAGAIAATGLQTSASTGTLVGHSSPSARATDRLHGQFGDEAVVILVQGDLEHSVLTPDLGRLMGLEGCLSGNVPAAGLAGLPAVCSDLARLHPAKAVYGPGTFINTAADSITQGFAQQRQQALEQGHRAALGAERLAAAEGYSKARQRQFGQAALDYYENQFAQTMIQTALTSGLTTEPSITNPQFVQQLVFDPSRGTITPKARFAYLFPSEQAALIQVRMRPNLSDPQRRRAIGLIERAVREPNFALTNGQRYYVTGVPVVVDRLAGAVQDSTFVLLAVALVVMALTLTLVFRSRPRVRLLPLALALAAAAMTYGALAIAGLSLTMASIAALPVMIGLGVDYAIQLQARFEEARSGGEPAPRAARLAARGGAPTLIAAAVATAAGFLVLLLSPIPMVHGFALLVIAGIALSLACALTAGLATLSLATTGTRPADLPPLLPSTRAALRAARARLVYGRLAPLFDTLAGAVALVAVALAATAVTVFATAAWLRLAALALLLASAALLVLARPGRRALSQAGRRQTRRLLASAVTRPERILAIAAATAVIGLALDTQTGVVSDVRQLVPQNLGALRDVNRLERATGVSGEIDVLVHGRDVTSPAAIGWMASFQQRLLARHGYRVNSTCAQTRRPPQLCPALSLTDLLGSGAVQASNVRALLAAVPRYFSQAVISSDRRTATLAFGIRLMPLDRQKAVIDDIRRNLDPPPGVTAEVAGLPVLAADANGQLASEWRRIVTLLAGLAAVFCVLLLVRRRFALAAVPLIPIALATGWSGLVLFLLRIPLNPMSATLGALVIAISTEFSVLLSARFHEERRGGAGLERALELAYSSTGAAVLASGVTAIAGFAVLMASDIRMLRDFGAVTFVDLTVSLAGVVIVLPAALVWAERRGRVRLRDLRPGGWWRPRRPLQALAPALDRMTRVEASSPPSHPGDGFAPALRSLPRPLPRRRRGRA